MANLQPIRDFPNYMLNVDTGDIVSKLQRGTHLKLMTRPHSNMPFVQMVQDGKRRAVFYYRLMWAIQNGVGYDELPHDMFIVKDDSGALKVIEKSQQIHAANNAVKVRRQRDRLKVIDDKIRELEIMRRAYTEQSTREVVMYIESRKALLVNHHKRKFNSSERNAEICYCQALEWMVQRIENPYSQITELTCSMMGLMGKIWKKRNMETVWEKVEKKI